MNSAGMLSRGRRPPSEMKDFDGRHSQYSCSIASEVSRCTTTEQFRAEIHLCWFTGVIVAYVSHWR